MSCGKVVTRVTWSTGDRSPVIFSGTGIFSVELLCFVCCCAMLKSHNKGEKTVDGYNPALCFKLYRCRVDVLQS